MRTTLTNGTHVEITREAGKGADVLAIRSLTRNPITGEVTPAALVGAPYVQHVSESLLRLLGVRDEDMPAVLALTDQTPAAAAVIAAAHEAGFRAETVPTGGGCEAVEITREDMAGYIYVTNGDAGLPDGGPIVVGRYDEDGSDREEPVDMPHDMPRLTAWLRNL